uniref:Glutamine cyclotransferase n=1 Tax=uncultured Aminicenantes bacterium TaxID=174294 RepID=Q2YZZ7_9BACT|nr:hypothetical protein [uncultured Aminicenantes bacterium]
MPCGCRSAEREAPRNESGQTAPIQRVQVVREYPHDPGAYTQGLLFDGGFLYESTGREGFSSVRKVDLATGAVVKIHRLAERFFGEGLALFGNNLIQLTWQSGEGFVYDKETFRLVREFRFEPEGWGLTSDGRRLILSDGTPQLRFLDPLSLEETGRLTVTDGGRRLQNINELEWVRGEIWANIWQSHYIVRIDPQTGRVKGWLDLEALAAANATLDIDSVLNGIAYDPKTDRIFVTGKLWKTLYEIRIAGN